MEPTNRAPQPSASSTSGAGAGTPPAGLPNPLLAEVRQLIDAARQRVGSAVNAELTQLYWHIGRRISAELLQGQRGHLRPAGGGRAGAATHGRFRQGVERAPASLLRARCRGVPGRRDSAHAVFTIELVAFAVGDPDRRPAQTRLLSRNLSRRTLERSPAARAHQLVAVWAHRPATRPRTGWQTARPRSCLGLWGRQSALPLMQRRLLRRLVPACCPARY